MEPYYLWWMIPKGTTATVHTKKNEEFACFSVVTKVDWYFPSDAVLQIQEKSLGTPPIRGWVWVIDVNRHLNSQIRMEVNSDSIFVVTKIGLSK